MCKKNGQLIPLIQLHYRICIYKNTYEHNQINQNNRMNNEKKNVLLLYYIIFKFKYNFNYLYYIYILFNQIIIYIIF